MSRGMVMDPEVEELCNRTGCDEMEAANTLGINTYDMWEYPEKTKDPLEEIFGL